jgi:hypothetical protein
MEEREEGDKGVGVGEVCPKQARGIAVFACRTTVTLRVRIAGCRGTLLQCRKAILPITLASPIKLVLTAEVAALLTKSGGATWRGLE